MIQFFESLKTVQVLPVTMGAYGVVCALLLLIQMVTSKDECFDMEKDRNLARLARKNACGVSKFNENDVMNRIMGGTNAELGEFPWMARLFYRSKNETEAKCGGSLIHEQYVLTAAHCCSGELSMELVSVRLGEFDTLTDEDCRRGRCAPKHKDYEVAAIYTNEEYDPLKFINDICLIRLEKEVHFTDYIYPICLPTPCKIQEHKFENTKLVAAGWGMKDEVYERPVDVLQKIKLATVSRKSCEKMWRKEDMPLEVGSSQICAGRDVGRDVCGGDSGGPLMYTSSVSGRARVYAVGLVSYGQPCSHRSKSLVPGVYTNVASYLPWITNIIGES